MPLPRPSMERVRPWRACDLFPLAPGRGRSRVRACPCPCLSRSPAFPGAAGAFGPSFLRGVGGPPGLSLLGLAVPRCRAGPERAAGGTPGPGQRRPGCVLFLARPHAGAERCQVAAASASGGVGASKGGGEEKASRVIPANLVAPGPLRSGKRNCRAGTLGCLPPGNRTVWGDVRCLGVPLSCSLHW